MLLLGGKTTLTGVHHVRRHAMPPTSTGNPLQEGGYLSARASHKSSPITRPNRARYRPAQLRINRGRGRPAKKRWRRAGRQGRDLTTDKRTGCIPMAMIILSRLGRKIDCQKQQVDPLYVDIPERQYRCGSPSTLPGEPLFKGCLSHA